MGFKVVKSKQLRELPLLEVKVELPSIDGGTTLPPEDEILYEIVPRLNREEKDIFGKKLLRSELKN